MRRTLPSTLRKSEQMKNGRRIDLEVITLKKALRWARVRDQIAADPFAGEEIGTFQDTDKISKSKERRPLDGEELHFLAERLFADGYRSEVLGFQCLFEAFTGVRTSEALRLRWDAKYSEAGHIDGKFLHLARSKKGVNPWVEIRPHLRQLLKVMRAWRAVRFPDSPWFFPAPYDAKKAVAPTSLTHALSRAVSDAIKAGKIDAGRKVTSHGLRGFYVTARRSEFVSDATIAGEIGDASGAKIIVENYGDLPPNWKDSKAGRITWLPKRRAAAWKLIDLDKVIPLANAA